MEPRGEMVVGTSMRWLSFAFVLLAAAPASAQDHDARFTRLLAQWTQETARRPTPPAFEGRPLEEHTLPDAHELWCRTQPPSCECGGLPVPPPLRPELSALRARMRACYENQLHGGRRLAGAIRVELVVAPNGTVTRARVLVNETEDEALGHCLARALQRTRLPARPRREGDVTLVVPIVFDPSE